MVANGPLHGVKVFEVSQIIAGPFCGMNLADLGADVVKVEPPSGEGFRVIGAFMPGESKLFHTLNRGKRSLVIDLGKPAGQELVHRLIAGFDVFIINSRPGVPERLRIDYETLKRFRPDLVYLENTGFGTEGPSATRAGSDIVLQAYSGLMAGEGKIDKHGAPYLITSTGPADIAAGLSAAMGICAALFHRARTGEGQKISSTLLGAALAIQLSAVARVPVFDALVTDPLMARIHEARARGASYREIMAIKGDQFDRLGKAMRFYYGGYEVKDGAVIFGALTPLNRAQMRRVLGVEGMDPSEDPDFNALDPANDEAMERMHEHIREIMKTKTMDEWMELLNAAGAPASKVNMSEELYLDPQVQAMGMMREYDHELSGPELLAGPIVNMSVTPTGTDRPSPPLGRHTDEVLAEYGVNAQEVAALREQHVIA